MWEMLIKRYWRVATLKESPENTPYSILLMAIISLIFLSLIIFQWYLADIKRVFKLSIALLSAISLLFSYSAFTFLVLKLNKKATRTLQTITTLFACHTIIHIFAFPLLLITPMLLHADINRTGTQLIGILYLILTLFLTFWQFVVTIHIYKQALEVDYLASLLASFGLFACNILIVSLWQ